MPDPKLQKLADHILAKYREATQPQPTVAPQLPPVTTPMDPAAYRVDRFMRRVAQMQDPAMQRQLAQAQALRAGARPLSGEEIPQ